MNSYDYVKSSRKRTKTRMVYVMGEKCAICGYNKCISALEFHHIDPNTKSFSISHNTNLAWEKLVPELKKCIMVCANCHREIHENVLDTTLVSSFNEVKNQEILNELDTIKTGKRCSICGKHIDSGATHCVDCSNIQKRKVPNRPDGVTLLKEIAKSSFIAVAAKYGVSDNAIRKWLKKEGYPTHKQEVIDYVKTHLT